MDLRKLVAGIFTIIFIITIYYFILKTLRLMKKDMDKLENPEKNTSDKPMWGLEVMENQANFNLRKGSIIPLTSGLTIGRKGDNTVILEDPYVSYYHLRFFIKDGRYVIEDLKSTNGTRLNHDRLEHKTYLKINDIITLGSTKFKVVN